MLFAIGSPANTGVVAQTTESGIPALLLTVPLGGSGGNFNQFPLCLGLNLCPCFPVSFGDSLIIAWFTFHRLRLYGENCCSLLSAKLCCCQGSMYPVSGVSEKLFRTGVLSVGSSMYRGEHHCDLRHDLFCMEL